MGEVYKATDTRLGRAVAIKILSGGGRGPRFLQEARAIAALSHPNICVLHDIGPDYLVMEYLDGAPVQGPLPLDEAMRVAVQIVDALDAAHGKGIFHRDLKPANIMVTRAGAKVLDFGLAKIVTDDSEADATRTMAGTVLGTAAYMSPEQAQGRPADARSDVFSFGAVLYEILTGKRAFGGASMLDTLSAVVHDEPSPSDSPAWDVIKRCLAKQPHERFQTMAEVRAALQQVRGQRPARRATGPSIAVLPFANMSRDPEDEYFSDGLAEEIINLLAQLPGLKVIARTSAFAFKGRNEDIRRIAETLGVTTILEGSVRRAGSRIRVMAQLIQASDGAHLWSQRYDREMADIFEVQDEISAAIASALKVKLAPAAERRLPKVGAYEAYLKYRSYQWQFTPEATKRSRECLEQAIALDPEFALPYVGLADSYLALASVGAIASHEAMPRARELAARALAIDPDLPEAHAMLGIVAGHYDYDWVEAAKRFAMARREQMSPHLRQWHAQFHLLATGRSSESLGEHRHVLDEDPLCQTWHYTMASALHAVGREEEALAEMRKSVELDPDFWLGWVWVGVFLSLQQQREEAMSCAEEAITRASWSPFAKGVIAAALANLGRSAEAEPYLAQLRDDPYGGPAGLTVYHVARGDADRAVESASRAVDQRYTIILITVLRPFEPLLRQSAGWPALMTSMNLAAASA
jgi:serine/threonine-protein kinase